MNPTATATQRIRNIAATEGWTDATLLAVLLDIIDDELDGPTADAIADAVWERAEAAH